MKRYAITHMSRKTGLRTLSLPNQGRNHSDSRQEAEGHLSALQGPDGLCRVMDPQEFLTLRVDEIECYDHGDARGIYVQGPTAHASCQPDCDWHPEGPRDAGELPPIHFWRGGAVHAKTVECGKPKHLVEHTEDLGAVTCPGCQEGARGPSSARTHRFLAEVSEENRAALLPPPTHFQVSVPDLLKLESIARRLYSEQRMSGDDMRNAAQEIEAVVRVAREIPA